MASGAAACRVRAMNARMFSRLCLVVACLLVAGCRSTYYAAWEKLGVEKRDLLKKRVVAARDEQGLALTDRELVDNLRVLLFAGHETTASILAWLTIQLAQRPDLWDPLCAESCSAAAVPSSIAEAKALPFGEAMFREVLRRYAPVWFTRRRVSEEVIYRG